MNSAAEPGRGDQTFIRRISDAAIRYRFSIFFLCMLALIALEPWLELRSSALLATLYVFSVLLVLRSLLLPTRLYLFVVFIGAVAVLTSFAAIQNRAEALFTVNQWSGVIFIGFGIWILLHRILTEENVTGETIKGGIAVYLLFGVWGALIFDILLYWDPQAFIIKDPNSFADLIYFSFTTMTTLGIGDIAPHSPQAKVLVILEATLGQIYLVVLIARLVGLHVSGR